MPWLILTSRPEAMMQDRSFNTNVWKSSALPIPILNNISPVILNVMPKSLNVYSVFCVKTQAYKM